MAYFSPRRLYSNWVYGGFPAGLLLLGLLPVISRGWSPALLLVFLQLPVYMIHQYEEHDNDRFRTFANKMLADGKEVFTPRGIFVVNIFGVWGVNLLSILLAANVNIGFGLIGVYLTLVNAIAHLGPWAAKRCYNPGLMTGIVLFLPLSIVALRTISPLTTWGYQALGLLAGIVVHLLIMVYMVIRKSAVK